MLGMRSIILHLDILERRHPILAITRVEKSIFSNLSDSNQIFIRHQGYEPCQVVLPFCIYPLCLNEIASFLSPVQIDQIFDSLLN